MMDESIDEELEFLEDGPTKFELQAAKDVTASFLRAMKNYGFYPENHPICQESIATAAARLDAFLSEHQKLRFHVEMESLLFRGEVVHQGGPEEGNLGLLLFRDGIQWLEFQQGLEIQEISGFIKIVNKYRETIEDAEGDLVTALWEADFPHLTYKAVDVYWEAEPLMDFSLLIKEETKEHRGAAPEEEEQGISLPLAVPLPSTEPTLWQLTPDELRELREMIRDEERRDSTQDVLDMVQIILNDQGNQPDLVAVLEFLADQFKDTLAQGEFRFSLELLTALHESRHAYRSKKPWALPLLDNFFMAISSPEVLGVLTQASPNLDMLDSDRMKLLRQALLMLPTEATLALGPMLLQLRSSETRRQFMGIIGIMAKRDIRPLERLLRRREEFMVQRLVSIVGHLKGEKPTEILLKLTHHSSERIRRHALGFLVARDSHPQVLEELFPLIEDASDGIRELVLKYLGQRRSEQAEGFLLDYLQEQRFQRKDRQHLLACYRALGLCGSSRSIPFLREALLSRGWIPGFSKSIHRQGAAVSLIELGIDEAKQTLEKASRSLVPSVRLAYRKAMGSNK